MLVESEGLEGVLDAFCDFGVHEGELDGFLGGEVQAHDEGNAEVADCVEDSNGSHENRKLIMICISALDVSTNSESQTSKWDNLPRREPSDIPH